MTLSQDETQIRSAIADWTRAIGRKDADAVSRFFTDDVVTFDLAPPLKNTGFNRSALSTWFDSWEGSIS